MAHLNQQCCLPRECARGSERGKGLLGVIGFFCVGAARRSLNRVLAFGAETESTARLQVCSVPRWIRSLLLLDLFSRWAAGSVTAT